MKEQYLDLKEFKGIIEEIEITELPDGTAAATVSFGNNTCFAAEKALRGRFLNDSKCKPPYVIGEIKHHSEHHDYLHQRIDPGQTCDQKNEYTNKILCTINILFVYFTIPVQPEKLKIPK
jgi:hypothetical protein